MPPPKKRRAQTFELRLGSAAGRSIDDFYVLAHSSEYDEAFEHQNVPTQDSPTSCFTHLLHYRDGQRDRVERIDDDLMPLWLSPTHELLAAGFPRGVYDLSAPGAARATYFKGHLGSFTGLWGPASQHLFACGMIPAFVLYRIHGQWQPMRLPKLTTDVLQALAGFSERDVYCVGNQGVVLHYDGAQWNVLEIPTTRALRCIAPLGRTQLCIGGEDGILLFGNRNGFRLVPSGTTDRILGIAPFQGAVYFGCSAGLYRFDGQSLPRLALAHPTMRASSLGDGLLLQHGHEAWTWDGQALRQLDTVV